jgi:hypothetical protein
VSDGKKAFTDMVEEKMAQMERDISERLFKDNVDAYEKAHNIGPSYSGLDMSTTPQKIAQSLYSPNNTLLKMLQAQKASFPAKSYSGQIDPNPNDILAVAVDPSHASLREEIRGLDARLRQALATIEDISGVFRRMEAKVTALEKLTARGVNLDAKLHKAIREPIDWTQVYSEDEDGLEEGYTGWPQVKQRVIF